MYSLFWLGWVRIPLFVVLFCAGYGLSDLFPIIDQRSDLPLLLTGISTISGGAYETLSRPEFAYALACMIVSTAAGLALAFFVMHVVVLRFALWKLQKALGNSRGTSHVFRDDFDRVRHILRDDLLIGHAFEHFADTCFRQEKGIAHNTIRPQVFLNASVAREKLFGLKMMPTIPGYFVGLGLLFTFVGLVIALSRAATAITSNPDAMANAVDALLNAATFKFSTSIAGLFASLILSLLFKTYSILIETGFEEFCRTLESRLRYLPPQSVSVEILGAMEEQVQHLKQITDDRFFTRLGEVVGPTLTAAMRDAVQPMVTAMDQTVDRLTQTSNQGVEGLIDKFTKGVQGGAGKEIQEMASVVSETRAALEHLKTGLSESGVRFTEHMAGATEKFSEVLAQSSTRTEEANATGRETMERLLAMMAGTLDQVKTSVSESVSQAGQIATEQLNGGLRQVLDGTAAQMKSFHDGLTTLQEKLGADTARAVEASNAAAAVATDAAARAATEIGDSLRGILGEAVTSIRSEVERMTGALKTSEGAIGRQTTAMQEVATQSNKAAAAFLNVAQSVNAASRPLTHSGEQIARAATKMSDSIEMSVLSLSESQDAAKALASGLAGHIEQIRSVWANYEERFENVDESLAKSVEALAVEAHRHQESVVRFVTDIDLGCKKAINDLGSILQVFSDNTEDLGETFETFLSKVQSSEKDLARA